MKKFYFALIFLLATSASAEAIRVASFNASLSRQHAGALFSDIETRQSQVRAVAEIIQRVRPDILLLNEFDYDPQALAAFQDLLRTEGQNTTGIGSAQPIDYPFSFIEMSNTGEASGFDLNKDGEVGGPGDAYGFGFFPGQYGMAVLSRFEIDKADSRTFRRFLWKDMPGHLIPKDFYSDAALDHLRLSSKSHWDLQVKVQGVDLHLLAAHPTPPVFDGPEDRNGRRNHDEIRLLADYVSGAAYIYDDAGRFGGLAAKTHFIVAGDMNADPHDGDSFESAVQLLLNNALINGSADKADITPSSTGGLAAHQRQSGANETHRGNPSFDTADFGYDRNNPGTDRRPGNLRVDYVLPSKALTLVNSGVFWLDQMDPLFKLAEWPTSDHRLVWIDVKLP